MKLLIFFSRVAFICNLFFLATVILRFVELSKKNTEGGNDILGSQFITATVVVLGYSAIFLNALLFFAYLLFLGRNKVKGGRLPVWLMVSNIIFLGLQVYYFFFL